MMIGRALLAATLAVCACPATAQTAPALAVDRVAEAASGLVAEIEDDNGPDQPLASISSSDCLLTVKGAQQSWVIDWRKINSFEGGVALEDSFIFLLAGAIRLAIVADTSNPDQAARLEALQQAISDQAVRCMAAVPKIID